MGNEEQGQRDHRGSNSTGFGTRSGQANTQNHGGDHRERHSQEDSYTRADLNIGEAERCLGNTFDFVFGRNRAHGKDIPGYRSEADMAE